MNQTLIVMVFMAYSDQGDRQGISQAAIAPTILPINTGVFWFTIIISNKTWMETFQETGKLPSS